LQNVTIFVLGPRFPRKPTVLDGLLESLLLLRLVAYILQMPDALTSRVMGIRWLGDRGMRIAARAAPVALWVNILQLKVDLSSK